MSGRQHDWVGKEVSEEEVAADLGFKDVHDLRRWSTDLGTEVLELKHELSIVKNDASNFRASGMKMMLVLEKIKPILEKQKGDPEIDNLLLATDVVCGTGVDWDHKLDGWFDGIHQRAKYE